MEFLNECLCNENLEELVSFLRMFNNISFCVYSTNTHEASSFTSNTIKDIAYEIKNDSLICPIHGCKISVPETSLLFKCDDIKYKKQQRQQR
jgi:hypothetical protein